MASASLAAKLGFTRRSLFVVLVAATACAMSGCHLFDFGDSHRNAVAIAWHVTATNAATPAFDGSATYFIAGDHSVTSIDAVSGKTRWHSLTGTLGAAPGEAGCQVDGDLVACGDSGIVAFRRADGVLAWRFDVPREQPGLYQFQLDNGVIFAGSFGHGTVYAIDATTGALRWTAPVLAGDPTNVNIPKLATDGDIVAAVFSRGTNPLTGGVLALDAGSGAVRWIVNFPQGGPDSSTAGISVALWQGSVIASSSDGKIYQLDRASGAVQSFFPGVGRRSPAFLQTPVGEDFRPIVTAGSILYAASTGDWLIAYDLVKDRELWRVANPEGSANGSPIVVDGNEVYVVNFNGRLAAFSATEPKFLWHIGDFEEAFVGSPAVGPDKIFVGGLTGFWAIDK